MIKSGHRQTDKQTGQTDRYTDRTDRQTGIKTGGQTEHTYVPNGKKDWMKKYAGRGFPSRKSARINGLQIEEFL